MYTKEKQKEIITHQKIFSTYEKSFKNKKTFWGIAILPFLGVALFIIGGFAPKPIQMILTFCMAALLIITPIWYVIDGILILKKLKEGRYQIVIDHVQRVTLPHHIKQYQQPGYLIFRKNGKVAAANIFRLADPNNDTESQLLNYWNNAQIGSPFYLVMIKKRILLIYSCEQYSLEETTK